MSQDNHGSQTGDGSINIGTGDFRGANVQIGNNGQPVFSLEQLNITRHPVFNGKKIKSDNLSTFSIVTGLASIVGLYFTLFQGFPQVKYASWSTLFLFSLGVAGTSFAIFSAIKRRKFDHFLFRKIYIELGTKGGIYANKFSAICPWCGSQMDLRNIGLKNGPRNDLFICERNPKQHTVLLDPTLLPGIEE